MTGTTIYQQRPRGGCNNCGAEVRTRKSHGWVCAQCERQMRKAERPIKAKAS